MTYRTLYVDRHTVKEIAEEARQAGMHVAVESIRNGIVRVKARNSTVIERMFGRDPRVHRIVG